LIPYTLPLIRLLTLLPLFARRRVSPTLLIDYYADAFAADARRLRLLICRRCHAAANRRYAISLLPPYLLMMLLLFI